MNPAGVVYALLAYGSWGLTPIYWKALSALGPTEVLAHRVLWTLVFSALLLSALRRWPEVRAVMRAPRERLTLLGSGALIASNWLIFIWAVTHGRILETSLGYYLNPLISVLLAVAFLGERLRPAQAGAVALAAAGVAVLVARAGGLPWVSLVLAGSFALYGLVHKLCSARPIPALVIETGLLGPVALLWMAAGIEPAGGALVRGPLLERALLVGAGPVTALPLLWFASAARRLPLSALGLFQYVAPSLTFVLAVFVYHEPFGRSHAVAFACIWAALALYSGDGLRRRRVAASAV